MLVSTLMRYVYAVFGRTGRIVERVNVVLLGESLAEGSLECAEVGDGKLQDLRSLLARDEEGCLGVLVLLGLALGHCALRAGIFGFSGGDVSISVTFPIARDCLHTLVSAWCWLSAM
jgi:hypothetical protein